MNTDQWNSEGDCKNCRRESYCKDTCKAAKSRRSAAIGRAMITAMVNLANKK